MTLRFLRMIPTHWRTRSINHDPNDDREHVQGWDRLLPQIVSVTTVLGTLWAGISWANSLSTQMAVIRADQLNVPDKIAAAIAADGKANPYVTRKEWQEKNADVTKALELNQAENRRLFGYLIEGDRYNRRVLSSIDLTGAKEKR